MKPIIGSPSAENIKKKRPEGRFFFCLGSQSGDSRIEPIVVDFHNQQLDGISAISICNAAQDIRSVCIIGASGGGLVEAVANGKGIIKTVRIKKEVVDPDDVEMLEDLITAAITDAQTKAEDAKKDLLGPMGGGLI